MCWGAVTIGGLTRLTESGLSITKWDLITGMRPPLTEAEWQTEFEKYKQFPEYKVKNDVEPMTMADFKFIWTMEWAHRMWGRAIGIVFLVPAAVFTLKGWFDRPMKRRMGFATGLLLFQGFLGWYMVKSGLNPENNSRTNYPSVSQYRLAAHLSSAMVLYVTFLWTGLSHVLKPFDHTQIKGIRPLRIMAHNSKAAIFATAVCGAFVAGLDAGLTYNSWPKFADRWVPEDLWLKEQGWRNLTENPTCVQFMHRQLAYTSLVFVTVTWLLGRRLPLAARSKRALHALMVAAYMQAGLGIATLLYYVPTALASLHQNGSMLTMTLAFWLTNELRRIPK